MDLFTSEFGFTLIGEKPISISENENFYLNTHPELLKRFLQSLHNTFRNAPHFVLKTFQRNGDWGYWIELLHKPSIRKLVKENSYLQELIANKFGTEEEFYTQIEDPSVSFYDVVDDGPAIGRLLGYGDANSDYFLQRYSIGEYLKKYPFVQYLPFHLGLFVTVHYLPNPTHFPYSVPRPPLDEHFHSYEAEWKWIQDVEWDLDREKADSFLASPPYFVELPFYICRHGGDSEKVRQHFRKVRAAVAQLFSHNSWQQAVETVAAKESRKNTYYRN